ncbi:endonuclease domain-containing protein [Urbifossiella limnaea]|uniref:DUF559 domain-containing protein n=1 Tax=Urbifossiella limnaea TaxID=2528023 RepID=A0A517Y354_9BACT|nr:DUF559 domain-containing protein [Urbifossiella limnaea]QDU24246.1 hypothetical protein ETAA1_62600 [Urbifossiella limnaea]
MPPTDSMPLDRLQTRRAQGVPTVTILAGPIGVGIQAWRGWAATRGRTVRPASDADPTALVAGWAEDAFAAGLVDDATAWLAAVAGADADRMTRHDLDRLWQGLPIDPAAPAARAAYRVLADAATGARPDPEALVRELADPAAVVRGLTGLLPEPRWPALLLVEPPGADPVAWLTAATAALEPLVAAEPRLPVAVAVRAEGVERFLAARAGTRGAALVREGLVEVRGVSGDELTQRLRAAGVDPPPAAAAALTAGGLADDVADAFVAAAATVRRPTAGDVASDFRSVHEQFLFEQLESLPQTAGLFRPNAELPFRHGPRTGEADLLAERPRVAVEVDGAVFHLHPEQYRRDRRKDWLYQQHGYVVLRFLAEDVVENLPAVLATIVDAVTQRLPRRGACP